jgi:hypothetical protein
MPAPGRVRFSVVLMLEQAPRLSPIKTMSRDFFVFVIFSLLSR